MSTKTPKVAIIANKNARSVTSGILDDIKSVITDETLFISDSQKHSKKIAQEIIDQGFDVVLFAGGDGTVAHGITNIMNTVGEKTPTFGVLRLGTGNGFAEALRVPGFNKRTLFQELQQAKNPAARINMLILRIGERYAPFAGTGLDANVLRDYTLTRKLLNSIPLLPEKHRGILDYAIAIAGISFWRYALGQLPEIVIRNGGSKAYRIDHHGNCVGKPKNPGEILYKGPISFAACSTVPYYGFDIPIFPQVASLHRDYFQLRFTSINALKLLGKLPDIITGKLSDESLWDFSCKEIIMETSGDSFQIGGDPAGKHKKMRINSTKIKAVMGSAAAAPEPPT